MAEIMNISHTHDQIMNWLISNPEKSLRECADFFHYSQSWLSQIIHSDVFQSKLKERQQDVFVRVAGGIPQKLAALADVAIEKVSTALEKSEDGTFALDVFDKSMHRLGYAPSSARSVASPAVVQQNNFYISQGDLANARELMVPAVQVQEVELVTYDSMPSAS